MNSDFGVQKLYVEKIWILSFAYQNIEWPKITDETEPTQELEVTYKVNQNSERHHYQMCALQEVTNSKFVSIPLNCL